MSNKTIHIQSSQTYFHVYNRGVNREQLFLEQRNYAYFLRRMEQGYDPMHLTIIAYCLMPNHFHLILKQREPGAIPSFMKKVCDGYAKAINRSLDRSGHLFQGPYMMKPIGSDEYLLHLSRYIHLNPVRAQLVSRPEQWEFSSYRSYITDDDEGLARISVVMNVSGGAKEYRKFVEGYCDEDRRSVAALLF